LNENLVEKKKTKGDRGRAYHAWPRGAFQTLTKGGKKKREKNDLQSRHPAQKKTFGRTQTRDEKTWLATTPFSDKGGCLSHQLKGEGPTRWELRVGKEKKPTKEKNRRNWHITKGLYEKRKWVICVAQKTSRAICRVVSREGVLNIKRRLGPRCAKQTLKKTRFAKKRGRKNGCRVEEPRWRPHDKHLKKEWKLRILEPPGEKKAGTKKGGGYTLTVVGRATEKKMELTQKGGFPTPKAKGSGQNWGGSVHCPTSRGKGHRHCGPPPAGEQGERRKRQNSRTKKNIHLKKRKNIDLEPTRKGGLQLKKKKGFERPRATKQPKGVR